MMNWITKIISKNNFYFFYNSCKNKYSFDSFQVTSTWNEERGLIIKEVFQKTPDIAIFHYATHNASL